MNVLLVAAKRELWTAAPCSGRAGLEPAIIDVDAFAIHNAFELNHPDAMQGVVGLVNTARNHQREHPGDGVPVLTRDLSVGPGASGRTCSARRPLRRGLRAGHPGPGQSGDLAQYVERPGRGDRRGVERAAAFLATASRSAGGWAVTRSAAGTGSGAERSAVEPAARAGGARQPGAAAQGARLGVRVGGGG